MTAVNDKYEIKNYCVSGDQIGINVRHFIVNTLSLGGLTDQEIADNFGSLAKSVYRPWMPVTARWLGVTVTNITTPPFPSPTISTTPGGDGTATGDALPTQNAGIIHLKSALGGRHGRGRVYVPFGAEVWNSSQGLVNTPGGILLDAIRALWGEALLLSVGLRATGLQPAIRNRTTNALTPITVSTFDTRWATQRRRGGFGRQNPVPF